MAAAYLHGFITTVTGLSGFVFRSVQTRPYSGIMYLRVLTFLHASTCLC